MALVNRVRELRATVFKGAVSQKELAERAGINPSTLSEIENQQTSPSAETALALARVLGVSVEHLFLPSVADEVSAEMPTGGSTEPQDGPDDRNARIAPVGNRPTEIEVVR